MKLTFNIFALLWLFFRICLSQFKLIRHFFFCLKGGDSLVSKLTDKITGASSHKLILAHLPLIMVCIEVIFFIHLIFLKFTLGSFSFWKAISPSIQIRVLIHSYFLHLGSWQIGWKISNVVKTKQWLFTRISNNTLSNFIPTKSALQSKWELW